MDRRYQILKDRLSLLSQDELKRIEDNIDRVCLDTYNYDCANDTFCPLAVALNLHETVKNPTNELIVDILSKRFQPVNAIGGVEGNFYIKDRKSDLLSVVRELRNENLGM
jgi:hypothetical protein